MPEKTVKRVKAESRLRRLKEARFGMFITWGLNYSLMDWHHPDGMRAARDPAAGRRFREFSHGCVQELCSNYGPSTSCGTTTLGRNWRMAAGSPNA